MSPHVTGPNYWQTTQKYTCTTMGSHLCRMSFPTENCFNIVNIHHFLPGSCLRSPVLCCSLWYSFICISYYTLSLKNNSLSVIQLITHCTQCLHWNHVIMPNILMCKKNNDVLYLLMNMGENTNRNNFVSHFKIFSSAVQ